jgi:hypothetical protein
MEQNWKELAPDIYLLTYWYPRGGGFLSEWAFIEVEGKGFFLGPVQNWVLLAGVSNIWACLKGFYNSANLQYGL